ncbi:1-(5-phosphoribosyl)-5-[(5-phosphoribosylamino)methylideneamino] imidazole-4-carboxamide isomerase [Fontisubflavum oceani]|uniref:1-(5-phosphoribosyl)-5-[(5- phosphoribosylamino)methylideneamino]imidazole-4- carboxamide isomerase n=1 Tax=Fontisubflavum oceani TaxID=2978973 RepID=UPI0025B565AF|nr:1-(5-phosphoribosyl)-5-[(5-phosphoribosylamino)methylideneamino] imidazole-4-carboxamide isomerase [Fontisubflavum oceani]WJY21834.1 1-(5-phosphoribosyl)-5-[(5-phosphoribosylamino)methylideneamino] imidazole-4-carboxamide isomerase [Fontisubflavum oceani]
MIIYPTIELQNGHCVSLYRGRLDEPQIWHVDPVAKAQSFAEAGAEWLHVTDFDWVAGEGGNQDLVQEIIRSAGIPVQIGGGFRSLDSIANWIDMGAGRVVVGTLAATNSDIVKEAAKRFPDQIVIALDVFQGQLMTEGWRKSSAITPEAFLAAYETDPLAAVIVTDIDADVEDSDGSLALVTRLADMARAPVIARGLSRSLDDISRLKYVPHVSGAIIGRALFDRSIDLAEALAVANAVSGRTPEFL